MSSTIRRLFSKAFRSYQLYCTLANFLLKFKRCHKRCSFKQIDLYNQRKGCLIEIKKNEDAKIQEKVTIIQKRIEEEKKKEILRNIQDFKDQFINIEDPLNLLDKFCDLIFGLTSIIQLEATGVYLGRIEKLKKAINDESNDVAHLDPNAHLIINYISVSSNHEFMKGKKTKVEDGITFEVFQELSTQNKNNEESQESPAENTLEVVKPLVPTIFIPEVVREPKMKYYKVPRLGCYFVCALTYKSYLNEESFDKAIENYYIVQEKINKQKEEKIEKEAEIAEAKRQAEEDETEYVEEVIEWEKFEEPPYENKEIQFVVCQDTLGQDRLFLEEEKEVTKDLVLFISKSWEEKEKSQLTEDKDLKVKFDLLTKEYVEKEIEPLKEAMEKAVEDKVNEFEGEMNEEEKNLFISNQNFIELTKVVTSAPISDHFFMSVKFRVIKYAKLYQSLFYFLGFDRESICQSVTNKLCWKVAKLFINEELLNKIKNYTPRGPKPGKLPKYKMLNFIERILDEYNEEDLQKYSILIYYIHKWIKTAIELRKMDIAHRMAKREIQKQEREEAIKKFEERKQRRDEAFQAAYEASKSKWETENPTPSETELKQEKFEEKEGEKKEESKILEFVFDEEGFYKQWDEENPEVIIPPEIVEELDDDYEIELK